MSFDVDPQQPTAALWIDAQHLAIDVHLATLQLPERERPLLGSQLHTAARAIARRLARDRVRGVCTEDARCRRHAARVGYLLRLAHDLGWLPSAVAGALGRRAERLRLRLAAECAMLASNDEASPRLALPPDERGTVALR